MFFEPLSPPTLRYLATARHGTFTGLITRKQGEDRGRGPDRKRYGDDMVHVVMITGFSYQRLVERSLERLEKLDIEAFYASLVARDVRAGNGLPITQVDVLVAMAGLSDSLRRTLTRVTEPVSGVYVPARDPDSQETIWGSKVYQCVAGDPDRTCHCRLCTGRAKAPLAGTIYIDGLMIGERVLEAAVNGPIPPSRSSAVTVVTNLLRASLPVGRYRSFRLEAGGDWILRAGGAAEQMASGMTFVAEDVPTDEMFGCMAI